MRRRLVTACTVLALLLQGFGVAWAAPMRAVASAEATAAAASGHAAMPCHGEAAPAKPAPAASLCPCCDDAGVCGQICGAGAAAALPVRSPELQDYLDAHFEALRDAPDLFPAHSFARFRPPTEPLS